MSLHCGLLGPLSFDVVCLVWLLVVVVGVVWLNVVSCLRLGNLCAWCFL